ncbi:MAG TPA: PKD domain-containing protein, partial [Bacteroidia bacterium]|nr:PKD domain-containing protein [Bacteroidia bacterium]
INTNADTEIQCTEASAYTGTINIIGLSINDLTGIEAFTALTGLECALNNLSSINLNSNIALLTLNCSGNPLNNIDVSNNTLLQTLQCHNIQISSLDVTNNTALTILDFSLNTISSIDLSNNVALITLLCGQNPLTTLDVSNNIGLQNLYCEIAQLTGLNLASNTALLNLNCSENSILTLDLSANTALQTLDCAVNQLNSLDLSNNTNLTSIGASFNNLTSLDLTNNTLIQSISVMNNAITSIDISSNTMVTSLSCSNNALTNLNVKNSNNNNFVVFDAINNPALTCIEVDDATFMNTNWSAAKDAGATYNISCACVVNIPDANFKAALVADLSINTNADTEIQCAEANTFNGSIDVSSLSISDLTGIEAFTQLSSFIAQHNQITSVDLSLNTALTYLDLGYNQISALNVNNNINLNFLSLSDNQLSTFDNSANINLTSLSLRNNLLTAIDVTNNTLLTVLDLYGNSITSIDLSSNTALVNFYGAYNPFGTLDVSQCPNLNLLECLGNSLTTLDLTANPNLSILDGRLNQFTSLDFTNNTLLHAVYVSDNLLTALDVSNLNILDILECQNNQLSTLNLQNGNNNNLIDFNTVNNSSLTCIQVDNVAFMNTNWSAAKDAGATYSTVCPLPCVVNIPDANFKAALVADLSINTNADTEIQCAEANAYTGTINVDFLGITDLTGIEAFTNITTLYCSNNNLTSIDLSSNTLLTVFACEVNQITSIDLTANTLLTSIDVTNNQLTSIDLTNNSQLVNFLCTFNSITNLDFSGNPLLETVIAGANPVSSVNLTNNPVLKNLTVGEDLTSLDLSNLPLLETLSSSGSPLLTSLDFSGNPNLWRIESANNGLTSLDISGNPNVTFLEVQNNNFSSLNMQNGNNINFTNLNLTNNPLLSCIQVDDVTFMNSNWTAAKDATAGYSLDCSCTVNIPDNNFRNALLGNVAINTNSDGVISCAEALAYNGTLNVDNLSIADLTGIEAFINLTELNCQSNFLTSLNVSSNINLSILTCNSNQLSALDVSNNTNLVELVCRFNLISNIDVSNNTLLSLLYCDNNLLNSLDISNNINLQYLDFGFNTINNIDLSNNGLLLDLICNNNSLANLNLGANTNILNLQAAGNAFTTINLNVNTALETVDFQNSQLTTLDLSSQSNLYILNCQNSVLQNLNIQNGNNSNITIFNATNNPSLTCIQVDDATFMNTNWAAAKDAGATYSNSCNLFADFFADFTAVCQGTTINFTDISTGTTGSTTYLWDFGDGQTSNLVGNVSHNYLFAGSYDVSLTITDGISSNQLFTNYITINPSPVAPILTVVDNCGSSEITATGIVGTLIWSDAGSGNPRTETAGTFTATQDMGGCVSNVSNAVTANPLAIPNTSLITGNMIPNCSGIGEVYSVTLDAGSSYTWSVPIGAIITSGATGPDNHSITVDFGTNNGLISVIETNAVGCVGSSVDTLVSLQGCALAANFMADVTTICEGAPVTYTDLSTGTTGSTTYAWDFGAGANPPTATGAGPHLVFYTIAGTANVSLTVTEGASNNLTQNNYITINTPLVPSISISSDIPSPCPGTNINLTANITNPGSSYTINWYRDGTGIGSGNSINTTVVNPSESYQAEYQTFDFCNSPQAAFSNTINAAAQGLVGNPGLSSSGAACVGSPISFNGSYFIIFGPVTPVSYEWKVNGVIQASTVSPFVSSTLNDGDLVEGSMNYDNGCGIVNFNFGSINAIVYPPITS